jgi:hypothetical protein
MRWFGAWDHAGCSLTGTGKVYCGGYNTSGELGDATARSGSGPWRWSAGADRRRLQAQCKALHIMPLAE